MANITWYYPETKKNDKLYEILVRQPGMSAATFTVAEEMSAIAEALLEPHHIKNAARNAEGDRSPSSISVTKGSVDSFVNIDDQSDGHAHHVERETRVLEMASGAYVG